MAIHRNDEKYYLLRLKSVDIPEQTHNSQEAFRFIHILW